MVRILASTLILIAAVLPAAADPNVDVLKKACHDDYEALCPHVLPGGGRILACLHQHEDKLSAKCHTALQTK